MKAMCPNDPTHTTFETTGHVMQLWLVDESGEFLDVLDDSMEVSHGADPDNLWRCATCGAEAVVTS